MKTTLLAAVGLIAIGATTASAQGWRRDLHPYEQRHHHMCQEKAQRLYQYERRAGRDGFVDRGERATIHALQRDLDATCGRFRWRG